MTKPQDSAFTAFKPLRPVLLLLALGFALLPALWAEDAAPKDKEGEEEPKAPAYERLPELPFRPGEKIFYKLRWSVFEVGDASMEFSGPVDWNGQKCWLVELRAQTNGFADKIFKVRDYNAVWVDESFSRPVHYIKNQKEGSTDREVVVTFDWENNKAQYSDRGNKQEPIDIQPDSWDPLGITYAVRTLKLDGVIHLSIPSTDGKKSTTTDIGLSNEAGVKIPAGRFDTVLLTPDIKDLGGVFKKSKRAGIKIWFSDDERHVPVKMASEVAVGSFVAEMVRMEGPDSEAYNPPPKDGKKR